MATAVGSALAGGLLGILGLLPVAGCQVSPADHPEVERLPGCFAKGVPDARSGMGRVRLRWVYQADEAFRPQGIEISLDGQRVYENHSKDQLRDELAQLIDIDVLPGRHRLDSIVQVAGWGSGPFAYLKDYRFNLPRQHTFSLGQGEVRCISLVVYSRDGLTVALEERTATQYVEERAP